MTLNLPEEEKEALEQLARRKSVSQTEILRRAIRLYAMIDCWRNKGSTVYAIDKETYEKLVIY